MQFTFSKNLKRFSVHSNSSQAEEYCYHFSYPCHHQHATYPKPLWILTYYTSVFDALVRRCDYLLSCRNRVAAFLLSTDFQSSANDILDFLNKPSLLIGSQDVVRREFPADPFRRPCHCCQQYLHRHLDCPRLYSTHMMTQTDMCLYIRFCTEAHQNRIAHWQRVHQKS